MTLFLCSAVATTTSYFRPDRAGWQHVLYKKLLSACNTFRVCKLTCEQAAKHHHLAMGETPASPSRVVHITPPKCSMLALSHPPHA